MIFFYPTEKTSFKKISIEILKIVFLYRIEFIIIRECINNATQSSLTLNLCVKWSELCDIHPIKFCVGMNL
jgi:hypothetical protein